MAYSNVGIVNRALGLIGVKRISSLTEDSTAASAANAIWESIRNEVLEAADWRFAKERVALAQNATSPVIKYDYAYTLPDDFLRICRGKQDDKPVNPTSAYSIVYDNDAFIVFGRTYPYIMETLSDGTVCLFTDYDNTDDDLYLTYIKIVTDPTKYTAQFVSTLAGRLAMELAIPLTEDEKKFQLMSAYYDMAVKKAIALNQSSDYLESEHGSDDWVRAGR